MAVSTRPRLILIVVGSSLRAEDLDRPLAYYLRQQLEEALARLENPAAATFHVAVVADFRWLHDDPLQRWPTISLGGPGVNAVAQRWLEEVPLSLAVDAQYYIQLDPDLDDLRASIWGMDNVQTQIAVSAFIQRFLPRFLEQALVAAPEAEPYEEDED